MGYDVWQLNLPSLLAPHESLNKHTFTLEMTHYKASSRYVPKPIKLSEQKTQGKKRKLLKISGRKLTKSIFNSFKNYFNRKKIA